VGSKNDRVFLVGPADVQLPRGGWGFLQVLLMCGFELRGGVDRGGGLQVRRESRVGMQQGRAARGAAVVRAKVASTVCTEESRARRAGSRANCCRRRVEGVGMN
jgi:hypothetical protein